MVKIHRAIPRNAKPTRADDSSWFGFEPCKFLPDLSNIFVKKEAWLYSIPATILVGMCGIFPLLVIPVEAGHALREGGELFCALAKSSCANLIPPHCETRCHVTDFPHSEILGGTNCDIKTTR